MWHDVYEKVLITIAKFSSFSAIVYEMNLTKKIISELPAIN